MFFFRPKAPEKMEKCCLVENPRHFFNLDCKTVFNKLCLLHKACVWDLLIQFLNVCKSLIFLFYPKIHYQTINFFSCKSAYNCKDE